MRFKKFPLITRTGFLMSSANDGICHCRSFNRANPSLRANGETRGRLWREPAAIHLLVRVSTMLCRPTEQTGNDRVAHEYNEAAHWETDYWQEARAYRDRCAEASRRNAVSTGIRRVTPWPRTRFASRFAVDTARRTAGGGLGPPAWLCTRTPSISCPR